MTRLAALLPHPIQYFAPLLRELAARPGIDLTVYYCSDRGAAPAHDPGFMKQVAWDVPLLDGYRYKFLPEMFQGHGTKRNHGRVNPAIIEELCRGKYDAVVVHGYTGANNWLTLLGSLVTRTPILLRGETDLLATRRFYKQIPREIVLRLLLRNVAACLYIGSHSREFYLHYHVPERRLFFAPYSVDNAYFSLRAEQLKPQRKAIRAGWGISDDRPVILFAGKLIPCKQPEMLLDVYRDLRTRFSCALLFAGDGPLRSSLERTIAQENIPDVRITGFLNQTEMPRAYIAGDFLVLPSYAERWGVVVNEAMNFALPIIVSDRVGCAPDLVRSGKNGYVFQHDSPQQLGHTIAELVLDPHCREAFGRASLRIVSEWNIGITANGIIRALSAIMDARESESPARERGVHATTEAVGKMPVNSRPPGFS